MTLTGKPLKGIKDPEKIRQFVAAVRAADRQISHLHDRDWRVRTIVLKTNHTMFDYQQPDAKGHFGKYGGSFVSETLTHAINELKDAYAKYQHDPEFMAEFESRTGALCRPPLPRVPRGTHEP